MKTFIVDSSNSLFATGEPLPPNFQRLTFENNILTELEAEVSGACCIVYPSFSSLLANSISKTGQVAPAQRSLLDAMEQIVLFYKRNRKRCTLLYLAEQNLTLPSISHPEILFKLNSQISAKQSGMVGFIADSSLLLHKEFSRRLAELESCSCGEVTFELQVNAQHGLDAFVSLQNENERKVADAETEAAVFKAELVKEQLEKDAEQKEKQAVQHARALEQKVAQTTQSEIQERLQDLEQENKQIFEQLHNVQELFEEKLEQLTQAEQKLTNAEKETANIKAALDREKQKVQHARATEQKIAHKMQKQLQEELTEAAQESERLLEQLHYVQELIEQEYDNKVRQQELIEAISQDRSLVFKQLEETRQIQVWLRSSLTRANHRLWSKNRTFRNEIKRQAKVLRESPEFVESQYIEMYPDTKTSSLEPAVHYLLFGAIEARNPSTTFHSLSYIQEYGDVAESGQNPLLHYIRHGQFEGRKPNPKQLRLPAPKD